MKAGVDAMLKTLDPFTNYISEAQIENYRLVVEGKYNGIGAQAKKSETGSPSLKSTKTIQRLKRV